MQNQEKGINKKKELKYYIPDNFQRSSGKR